MGLNGGELPPDLIQEVLEEIALEYLDHEVAPRPEKLFCRPQRRAGQVHRYGMVHVPGPGEIGGGIA